MSEKWIVTVYSAIDEIECDSEFEADIEMDRQSRLYENICRVRVEERDDEDDDEFGDEV